MVQLVLFILSESALGLELRTRVLDVDISSNPRASMLVFFASGHVGKLSAGNKFRSELLDVRDRRQKIFVLLDDDREITELREIAEDEHDPMRLKAGTIAGPPSVLNSLAMAQMFFKEARYKDKESQCFNRAHVWSYEWKKKYNVNTSKLFIFFTPRYIREHDFHWWFHVAPLVHVAIPPDIKERVMDRKYQSGPVSIREWIDTFMEKGTSCRTVKTYSEYANYPESGDCFLIRADMYTYWPLDLELLELNGIRKTSWIEEELKQAYLDAFDVTIQDKI